MIQEFFQETVTLPQLMGWLAFITLVSAYQMKTAKKLRFVAAIALIFFTMHYYLMGAFAAMIIASIAAIRGFLLGFDIVFRYRKWVAIFALILAYISVYISGAMTSWIVVFALFGTTMSCLRDVQSKAVNMRAISFLQEGSWLMYFIAIGSHGGMANSTFVMVSSLIGMWRHDRKKEAC